MSLEKKLDDNVRKKYKSECMKGNCPNLKEIEDSKVKELAERLAGYSDRETLTNISEWHNDNMTYWFERHPLFYYVILSIIAPIVVEFVVTIIFSLGGLILTTYFSILLWAFVISVTVFVTLLIVMVSMITYYRKIPLSEVLHVFDFSISIDFLLKRKLAVCRDYAKLSAAILFNIFREKDVYFVYARQHVSTGIMVENKLYILDKYLPVTTFTRWNEKWNKGKFSKKKVKRAKEGCMFFVDDPDRVLSKTSQSELNLYKLSSRLEQMLGIESSRDNSKTNSIQILALKKGAKLYEDDEIVNYSIARRLEAIISRERLNKNQIAHIEIKRDKDDLIFLAHLK